MAVNDKKVFLYVGKDNVSGNYDTYTEAEIKAFNANEYVLTCGNYPHYLENFRELADYVEAVYNLAKKVIECTRKFVWLGLPRPPEITAPLKSTVYEGYANKYILEFIEPIQKRLKALIAPNGNDYYYEYVQGFYMNDEHVQRKHFSWGSGDKGIENDNGFDTVLSNLLLHPQIKMYSMISDKLKLSSYGWKKFLWVPYAGRGGNYDTTFIDIAYIANTTDIFDTVLLQPGVYEHYDPSDPNSGPILKNLDVIRNSMNIQEVRTRDGQGNTNNQVVRKRSSTKIGCQMEVDPKYSQGIDRFITTYNLTKNALQGNKVTVANDRHFSFYLDKKTSYTTSLINNVVNPFFNTL